MIRLLHRSAINDISWNERIRTSPYGHAFFMTWYLDACTDGNWFALVENNYDAVMPLAGKEKLGIGYLYQPFFHRYMGVISGSYADDDHKLTFLEAIPEEYKYLDFCLHESHRIVPKDCLSEQKTYQVLDLKPAYTELEKHYSSNLKRVLRKTHNTGFRIREHYKPETLVEQFRKNQTQLEKTFQSSDYQRLIHLMHAADANASTRSLSISHPDGSIHAGGFFIESCGRLLYLKGYSTADGKKSGAMHHLFDHVIKANAGRELLLDFGGSSVKSVARFYHHFGSTDCLYLRLRANRLPRAIRWLKY
jgi:hypothetical protein